jgi:hypothetical protein
LAIREKKLFFSKKIITKVFQYISAFNMGAFCTDHILKARPELRARGHNVVQRH